MLLRSDFSKAFDSVGHVLLLKKLLLYGFSPAAIRWFASYLSDRSQATLGGGQSSFSSLNKGMPQGSVLGPLLFFLFINDVCDNFAADIQNLIYADDLQIYMRFSR